MACRFGNDVVQISVLLVLFLQRPNSAMCVKMMTTRGGPKGAGRCGAISFGR